MEQKEENELIKDKFKGKVQIETVRFYKDNWGILVCSVVEKDKKYANPVVNKDGFIIVKGTMPEPDKKITYSLAANLVNDAKWGKQYEITSFSSAITFDRGDKFGQKRFLQTIFADKWYKALYTLDDPFTLLETENVAELVQAKGIALKTAMFLCRKFRENYSLGKMMLELEEYHLTNNMLNKLLNNYKSADLAIDKVKSNPYILATEVQGIGWKKADEIALSGGLSQYSTERISAFMIYYLEEQAQNGFNYISTDLLMDAIVDCIGEEVPDLAIAESIHGLGNRLWYNKEKTLIGLMKYRKLDENIAKELLRIRDAKSDFNIENWEEIVRDKEIRQGWDYTDQQRLGIETVLKNNIVMVTGKAGVGKSTIADAMLETLKDYSHALCALSGRASARIAEITGEDGYTIHRLLGYPSKEENSKNGFSFHDEHPLPYDIIIVDEVSMIGGYLFYHLLRAVKSGAKVVLLGDCAQLEAIGECKVASDIIESPEIPTVMLDKIHRQAAKSAIITESLKVRDGIQIIPKNWAGTEVRGELQDLLIDCYSDKTNTIYKVLEYFQKEIIEVKDIMEVQIISPVRNNGDACTWNINNIIQDLYNEKNNKKKQIEVFYGKDKVGYLREGDKVINTKNNYKTCNIDGNNTPIFNGNIGILREIDEDNDMYTIDFKDIGTVILDKDSIKAIELGYAITCHKFQGSQSKNVIIALDYSSYTLLSREWVYTAITRAQKHCTLVAQNSALRYAISQEKLSEKTSHLVECLDEIAHPKLSF